MFFNRDKITITFVGFNVNRNGDLVHPSTREIIEPRIMSSDLQQRLRQNRVNLNENYQLWNKSTMMEKLAPVMGLEERHFVNKDPDPSYVLTVDNLIKILAIQMKFRLVANKCLFLYS